MVARVPLRGVRTKSTPFDMWYRPNFVYSMLCLKLQDREQNKIKCSRRNCRNATPVSFTLLSRKTDLKRRWNGLKLSSARKLRKDNQGSTGVNNASYEFACKLFAERHHYFGDRIEFVLDETHHKGCATNIRG